MDTSASRGDEDPQRANEVGASGIHQVLDGFRSPAAIWQTTYGELQLQMLRETFDSWLRHSQLVDYQDTNGLPIYVVRVRSECAKAWLEKRLSKTILRTLSSVAGHDVDIRFVLPE